MKENIIFELEKYFLNILNKYHIELSTNIFPYGIELKDIDENIILRYDGKSNSAIINNKIWEYFRKIYNVNETVLILKEYIFKYLGLNVKKHGIIPGKFYYDQDNNGVFTISIQYL